MTSSCEFNGASSAGSPSRAGLFSEDSCSKKEERLAPLNSLSALAHAETASARARREHRQSLQYAADKSLDRQGLLSTNRSEDTALVITTPRSSTRSFTDDLAPGLSTKDRAHWDRGLDPGPERQHARYCQGPKARSHTIDRTEHQVHRRFQAGFRLRGVQS